MVTFGSIKNKSYIYYQTQRLKELGLGDDGGDDDYEK